MPTPAALRVYLAEDSRPIRERIAGLLVDRAMQVVGGAATPADCIAGILEAQPNVVVLDAQLEGGTGMDVMLAVRAQLPQVAFVVLSNHSQSPYIRRYLSQGAASFLDKSLEFEQLPAAVARAAASPGPLH